ncbi:MAG: ECF-type sigma factor, partial [Acidobacteriota bacterium]
VELHFFAGLSVAETAEIVGCSKATVSRDWRFAKAWIGRELGRESGKSEQCEEPRREA